MSDKEKESAELLDEIQEEALKLYGGDMLSVMAYTAGVLAGLQRGLKMAGDAVLDSRSAPECDPYQHHYQTVRD